MPGVEHADQHDAHLAHRSSVGAAQVGQWFHHPCPVAVVPDQQTTVIRLRIGVAILEVVTGRQQQIQIAISIEVRGHQPGTAKVVVVREPQPAGPEPRRAPTGTEILEPPDLLLVLSRDGGDV